MEHSLAFHTTVPEDHGRRGEAAARQELLPNAMTLPARPHPYVLDAWVLPHSPAAPAVGCVESIWIAHKRVLFVTAGITIQVI